jgi:hypothetical protein
MNPTFAKAKADRQAVDACVNRAITLFAAEDKPLWKRTQEGMLAFKGLNMDQLPDRLLRDLDRCFLGINKILAGYTLQTWADYQRISDEDLLRIQRRIAGLSRPAK